MEPEIKTARSLAERASLGGSEDESRLLLFLINTKLPSSEVRQAISRIKMAENWRRSKKYYFARLKILAGESDAGLLILQELSDQNYLPAMCKLGSIMFGSANSEKEKQSALNLVNRARLKGHVWAARNYWIMKAKSSNSPFRFVYFFIGGIMLARILIIRSIYSPGELTTY